MGFRGPPQGRPPTRRTAPAEGNHDETLSKRHEWTGQGRVGSNPGHAPGGQADQRAFRDGRVPRNPDASRPPDYENAPLHAWSGTRELGWPGEQSLFVGESESVTTGESSDGKSGRHVLRASDSVRCCGWCMRVLIRFESAMRKGRCLYRSAPPSAFSQGKNLAGAVPDA
jgi:hypothetical protein